MFGSIFLFICGCGMAFCGSMAYDNFLENKVLKERLKRYEQPREITDEEIKEALNNGD